MGDIEAWADYQSRWDAATLDAFERMRWRMEGQDRVCGLWRIVPKYWGRTRASSYDLHLDGAWLTSRETLRDVKRAAARQEARDAIGDPPTPPEINL